MALFTSKKKIAVMNDLKAVLSKLEILSLIMHDVKEASKKEDNLWMTSATDYYDTCSRTVLIGRDDFMIMNCSISEIYTFNETIKKAQKAFGRAGRSLSHFIVAMNQYDEAEAASEALSEKACIGLSYTGYGFRPLSEYYDEGRNYYLTLTEVLETWAAALQDAMELHLPDLYYADDVQRVHISGCDEMVAFSYDVPDLQWKSWS